MRGVPSCSTPLSLCCGSAAPAPFLFCLRPIESTHPPRADPIRVELLGGSLRCPLSQDALTGSYTGRDVMLRRSGGTRPPGSSRTAQPGDVLPVAARHDRGRRVPDL